MALLDFFLSRKKSTANIAKERLQIIVNVVVVTPSHIIYRSCVRIFSTLSVSMYKLIPKWSRYNLNKKTAIFRSSNLT